jgi:hypothetical protein
MSTSVRTAKIQQPAAAALAAIVCAASVGLSHASDHLDTPTVIANPQADIGDVYAWTSYTGRQLNLVMTLVGHSFSDRIQYAFHVDSGRHFGQTIETTLIECSFPAPAQAVCRVADSDSASGARFLGTAE